MALKDIIQFPIHSPRAHEKLYDSGPMRKERNALALCAAVGMKTPRIPRCFEKNQVSEILRLLKQ
jgi:hypothetical protein